MPLNPLGNQTTFLWNFLRRINVVFQLQLLVRHVEALVDVPHARLQERYQERPIAH